MKDIYIFDLDGTLALIDHRRHLVTNGNNQWDEFYRQCVNDTINEPVAMVLRKIEAENEYWDLAQIYIVSGRSAVVEKETRQWLKDNKIFFDKLIMRSEGDYTPDHELKRRWLNDSTLPKDRIIAVFDDRKKVVNMWRAEGLICFQVAEGDF